MSVQLERPEARNTLGLVFAGGRATRMGGVNKGLVLFEGRPLAGIAIERLAPQVRRVAVSANRDAGKFLALGAAAAVPDRLTGFPGPLAAIDAAAGVMDACEQWLFTVPCDVPYFPKDLLAALASAFDGKTPAYAARAAGRSQNTFALIHRSLLPTVAPFVEQGDRKLGLWLEEQGVREVEVEAEPFCFANVNSPDELQALEKAGRPL
jgi:molybdopterin-guanine dinucleotide biosynthesis protein A